MFFFTVLVVVDAVVVTTGLVNTNSFQHDNELTLIATKHFCLGTAEDNQYEFLIELTIKQIWGHYFETQNEDDNPYHHIFP